MISEVTEFWATRARAKTAHQIVDERPQLPATAIPLDRTRLQRVKQAYAARRIDLDRVATLLTGERKPRAGDFVLARVDRIGQHTRIELPNGRRSQLFVGDEILVCYGARYASDQFEAVVPENTGFCHLVAAGGIAATCLRKHDKMKRPTEITSIGLLADDEGKTLNLAGHALSPRQLPPPRPFTVAVIGTGMNAGKTTTVASLIRGMSVCGLKVGAAKVTGTGAGGDRWAMVDAGARLTLDFTDAGHPSTHRLSADAIEGIVTTLVGELSAARVDAIVLEVADGLFLDETADLVRSAVFSAAVDGVMLAAADSMGAYAGTQWIRRHEIPLFGVSGLLSASPLSTREAALAVSAPVIDAETIRSGAWLPQDHAETVRRLIA